MWHIARWSKKTTQDSQADPQLPALRWHEKEARTDDARSKAKLLADKFFPQTGQADLRDIKNTRISHVKSLFLDHTVREQDICNTIANLPTRKATRPDEIPNEMLQELL